MGLAIFNAIIFLTTQEIYLALFYSTTEVAMQIKRYLLPTFFIVIMTVLLSACNLRIYWTDEDLPPTPSSKVPDTATPLPSPTSTLTLTPAAPIQPTPTWTLFFAPTVTPTKSWSACPGIVVTTTDTDAGDILHILRCEDGLEYDLGPLAKGTYAVGPNEKFLVYITVDGIVYSSRIGESRLFPLFNLKREHIFTVLNIGTEPDFLILFSGGDPSYKLVLVERNYDQKRMYELPRSFTH